MEAIFWTENLKLERASLLIYDRKSQPMKNFHLFFVISQKQWKPNLGNVKRCCWVPDRLIFPDFSKFWPLCICSLCKLWTFLPIEGCSCPGQGFSALFCHWCVCGRNLHISTKRLPEFCTCDSWQLSQVWFGPCYSIKLVIESLG